MEGQALAQVRALALKPCKIFVSRTLRGDAYSNGLNEQHPIINRITDAKIADTYAPARTTFQLARSWWARIHFEQTQRSE
jgi:hypothetical protein